jgi:ABC-type nitrate/sulfonate/bicarbonate transport system ATPase subunit
MDESTRVEEVICCEGIRKDYASPQGTIRVIEDVSIRAAKNEFLVILGPGQCGKTTLLKVISGLETATAGTVRVDGKIITQPGPECGLVYQTTALFQWLTTMGNVEYGPRVRGIGRRERRKKAQYYINLVGLSGFEKSFPIQLSGGMQQRVGIARVYCNEPSVAVRAPGRPDALPDAERARAHLETGTAYHSVRDQ